MNTVSLNMSQPCFHTFAGTLYVYLAIMFCTACAYSFVPRSEFQGYKNVSILSQPNHHRFQRRMGSSLEMKLSSKQRKIRESKRRKEDPDFVPNQVVTGMPQNLKRKVEAKRPPLGHVVPNDGKKGAEIVKFDTLNFVDVRSALA